MIRSAADVIERCQALADGGWHPASVCLEWRGDTGWELCIQPHDWLRFGVPQAELVSIEDLPVPYAPNAPLPPDMTGIAGVTVGGGLYAPPYVEPIDRPEHWWEQAEAIIREVSVRGDAGSDGYNRGSDDGRNPLWPVRRRWYRCGVWAWQREEDQAIRERQEMGRLEKKLAALPSPEQPVQFNRRQMRVLRPCGCITQHWAAPGKGRSDTASKRRFGQWLAERPCPQHA